jgi:hypothetical protein
MPLLQSPFAQRVIYTILAALLIGASVLHSDLAELRMLASLIVGWVWGKRPGDEKAAAKSKDEDPPQTPRSGGTVTRLASGCFFLLACAFLFAPALPACSSSQPLPVQAVQAREVARSGYAAAALAVKYFAEAHRAYIRARPNPTLAEAELSGDVLQGIDEANAALKEVRPWVVDGRGDSATKDRILFALDMLLVVGTKLAGAGEPVPKETVDVLNAARALLGGVS